MGLGGSLSGLPTGGLDGTGLHKYDTGHFRPQRSMVRQGVIDKLAPLLVANGRYAHAIAGIPRPLKSEADDELALIEFAIGTRYPAICVGLGRKDYEATGMDIPAVQYRAELELAIYVMTANARAREDGRLSTDIAGSADLKNDPGIEAILEHIEQILLGQDIDIAGVSEMRPKYEDEVFTGAEFSVWEQRYSVKVNRDINPDRDVDGIVTSIEMKDLDDDEITPHTIVDSIADLEVD